MSSTEKTPPKQLTPWKPGQSGNPAGRPKGSRNKINELFLQDMFEAWQAFGRPALLATAWQEPATFVKVAAQLLPKEFKVDHTVSELTDEQLQQRIRELVNAIGDEVGLAPASNRAKGTNGSTQGTPKPH